jgi:hypothetical protein
MRIRKMVISTAAVGAIVLGSAAAAFAASRTDTGDHFSLASGTAISGSLKTGTHLVITGSVDGLPITVTCTTFKAAGTVPATGLKVTLSAAPTISGCKDNAGGTDTIKTNTTNGKWTLTEVDKVNDETITEPNSTGDSLSLGIPKAGATFASSLLSGCVITVAPTAAISLKGSFNDATTVNDKNAPLPVAGNSKCTTTTGAVTGTIVLSKSIHDVS